MTWLTAFSANQFVLFTLVLTRVSGVVIGTPIYGSIEVPARVRAFLAVALAVLMMPTQWHTIVEQPANVVDFALLVAAELLIGLTLGTGTLILFSGVQLAGHIISQIGGMSLGEALDPNTDNSVPILSELLRMFALAIFVAIGGHRLVLAGLLGTFEAIPAGQAQLATSLGQLLSVLLTESLSLGVRMAAPAMTALLLATLVLGLVSRTVPQLNVFSLGFALNAVTLFVAVALSLGGIAWLFEDQVPSLLNDLLDAILESQSAVSAAGWPAHG
ncbi:MAG: flagellar biosynthetic protein FliR [Pirellulales bacterium]